MQILVDRLDAYHLTHTKKYMTPIHALSFQNLNMSKCVFIVEILKSRCNFLTLWRSTCSKKKGWLGGQFSELGFAGSGARKPRREFEGSALELFFMFF